MASFRIAHIHDMQHNPRNELSKCRTNHQADSHTDTPVHHGLILQRESSFISVFQKNVHLDFLLLPEWSESLETFVFFLLYLNTNQKQNNMYINTRIHWWLRRLYSHIRNVDLCYFMCFITWRWMTPHRTIRLRNNFYHWV